MSYLLSDQEQFELLRQGDKAAYAYFFRRLHASIYNYIRKMGADECLTQDLCQEAFKRLWHVRGNLNNAGHLTGYLYVMARNLFLEHLRKMKVKSQAVRELAYTAERETSEEEDLDLVKQRILAEIKAAIKGLSSQRQTVLQLLFFKGLEVRDVAKLLGLSEQTVRNHKAQATALLRKNISIC